MNWGQTSWGSVFVTPSSGITDCRREAPRPGEIKRNFLYTRLIRSYKSLCIRMVLFLKVHNRIMNSHLTEYSGISELLRDGLLMGTGVSCYKDVKGGFSRATRSHASKVSGI